MNVDLLILQHMIQALIKTNEIKGWFIYCCYQLFFKDQSNSIEYKVADFVFNHRVLFCSFTVGEYCTKQRLHGDIWLVQKVWKYSFDTPSILLSCHRYRYFNLVWLIMGLLVDNEADLLATAAAVFVKNMLPSGWTFSLSLCFLKLLWETRAETPILAMSIFLLHKIHNAFVESPGTFFSHLLKHSSASQMSLKVVTPHFLDPGILLY